MQKTFHFKRSDIDAPSFIGSGGKPSVFGLLFMGKVKYRNIEDINAAKHPESLLTCLEVYKVQYPSCKKQFCKCMCKCGKETHCHLQAVISGTQKSCGCLNRQRTIARNTKWINNTRHIGGVYRNMIDRCYNKRHTSYSSYGGKGVKVCDEWLNNYQLFINWCNENGIRKGFDLDKDKKGVGLIYSPETCCFISSHENRKFNNRSPRINYNGVEMHLIDACRFEDVSYDRVGYYIRTYGITLKDAIAKVRELGHTFKQPIKYKRKK